MLKRAPDEITKHNRKSIRYTDRGNLGPRTVHVTTANRKDPTTLAAVILARSAMPAKRHQPRSIPSSEKTAVLAPTAIASPINRFRLSESGKARSNRSAYAPTNENAITTV